MKSNERKTLKKKVQAKGKGKPKKKKCSSNEEMVFSLSVCDQNLTRSIETEHLAREKERQGNSLRTTCAFMHTYVQFAWLRTHYKNASDYYDDDHILWHHRSLLVCLSIQHTLHQSKLCLVSDSIWMMRTHEHTNRFIWYRHRKTSRLL